jgi:hypothetical protein
MTELEKLKHLLKHWIEHNDAHIKNYGEWAAKTGSLGKEELSEILNQIVEESKKLNALFSKASEII